VHALTDERDVFVFEYVDRNGRSERKTTKRAYYIHFVDLRNRQTAAVSYEKKKRPSIFVFYVNSDVSTGIGRREKGTV